MFTFVRMVHISILTLRNAVLGSISDTADVFEKVNEFFRESGKEPPFDVQLVGFSTEVKLNSGKYIIRPDVHIDQVKETDLIIIPSFIGHAPSTTYLNKDCAIGLQILIKPALKLPVCLQEHFYLPSQEFSMANNAPRTGHMPMNSVTIIRRLR